jgi:predicted transcriptional regulator
MKENNSGNSISAPGRTLTPDVCNVASCSYFIIHTAAVHIYHVNFTEDLPSEASVRKILTGFTEAGELSVRLPSEMSTKKNRMNWDGVRTRVCMQESKKLQFL